MRISHTGVPANHHQAYKQKAKIKKKKKKTTRKQDGGSSKTPAKDAMIGCKSLGSWLEKVEMLVVVD